MDTTTFVAQILCNLGTEVAGNHRLEVGLCQESESVRTRTSQHLVEIARCVERLEVLEANNPVFLEPTLGVLVKDTFFFIANSQWPLIGEDGKFADETKLLDPVVLKIKLDR